MSENERARVLRQERIDRFHDGHCPDCDDLCEDWTDHGVSCGYPVGEPLTNEEMSGSAATR